MAAGQSANILLPSRCDLETPPLPWSPPQPTLPSSWWQLCYCELFDTLNVKPGLKYFQIANILTALSGEKIKIYNFCWHCSSMERRKRRQDLQSVKYYILLIFAECPMTGDVWVRIREAGTHVAGGELCRVADTGLWWSGWRVRDHPGRSLVWSSQPCLQSHTSSRGARQWYTLELPFTFIDI